MIIYHSEDWESVYEIDGTEQNLAIEVCHLIGIVYSWLYSIDCTSAFKFRLLIKKVMDAPQSPPFHAEYPNSNAFCINEINKDTLNKLIDLIDYDIYETDSEEKRAIKYSASREELDAAIKACKENLHRSED